VTLFQAIDLEDRLLVTPGGRGFRLTANDPTLPTGDDNLVIRAARLLARESGRRGGAEFRLTKRIPDGAGLGGGSSDAAAALVALDRLWGLGYSRSRLARLGLEIGSDVPFFFLGGAAVGRGRGNRLTPLKGDRVSHFVLLHSPSKISTKWAYSQFKNGLTRFEPPPRIAALEPGDSLSKVPINNLYNMLEPGLMIRHPDIATRKTRLQELGAEVALLTGSGSTVYGVFLRREQASRVARRLSREGFRVDLCRSVSHGVVIDSN
jgi:4-diphosphocytidyl-2-C-methyl-D-erythritol kinase